MSDDRPSQNTTLIQRLRHTIGSTIGPTTGILSEPLVLPPRPDGAVLWLHAPRGTGPRAARLLADMLCDKLADHPAGPVHAVITHAQRGQGDRDPQSWNRVLSVAAPGNAMEASARFISATRPDWALWLGPDAPETVRMCRQAKIPMALRLSTAAEIGPPATLAMFDLLIPTTDQLAAQLRSAAPDTARIVQGGPISEIRPVLRAHAAELDHLTDLVLGRPVWLICCPDSHDLSRLAAVLRTAFAQSQRLLVILLVEPGAAPDWAEQMRTDGWRVAERDVEGDPAASTQVLVTDEAEEAGMWLRLSSIAWFPGKPAASAQGLVPPDPWDAASLGAAVILGGGTRPPHERTALDLAKAVIRVTNPQQLNAAITRLLIPAEAATQAAAGWQTTTRGAPMLKAALHAARAALDGIAEQPAPLTASDGPTA